MAVQVPVFSQPPPCWKPAAAKPGAISATGLRNIDSFGGNVDITAAGHRSAILNLREAEFLDLRRGTLESVVAYQDQCLIQTLWPAGQRVLKAVGTRSGRWRADLCTVA